MENGSFYLNLAKEVLIRYLHSDKNCDTLKNFQMLRQTFNNHFYSTTGCKSLSNFPCFPSSVYISSSSSSFSDIVAPSYLRSISRGFFSLYVGRILL